MLRGAGAPLLLLGVTGLASCQERTFWCQREPEAEGRARRCQESKDGCEKYLALKKDGCDAQTEVHCFFEKPMGNLDPQLVCAATEADCQSWRKVKKSKDPSPCKLTRASEL